MPTSKVYTQLNIVDEYRDSSTNDQSLESKNSFEQIKFAQLQNMKAFNVKVLDQGKSTVKLELEFNQHIWIISKTKDSIDQYLKSINVESLSDLNLTKTEEKEKIIKTPSFSTLLFFDFFKKMDLLT